jgi:hypothetical protein
MSPTQYISLKSIPLKIIKLTLCPSPVLRYLSHFAMKQFQIPVCITVRYISHLLQRFSLFQDTTHGVWVYIIRIGTIQSVHTLSRSTQQGLVWFTFSWGHCPQLYHVFYLVCLPPFHDAVLISLAYSGFAVNLLNTLVWALSPYNLFTLGTAWGITVPHVLINMREIITTHLIPRPLRTPWASNFKPPAARWTRMILRGLDPAEPVTNSMRGET